MRIIVFLLALSAPLPQDSKEVPGKVTGTVTLKGDAPKRKPFRISCPACAPLYPAGMPREDLAVNAKNQIQGAVVFIRSGLEGRKFEVPEAPVILEQKGCRYEPHAVGLMTGQKLIVRNRDPHCHNAHAIPFNNKEFNVCLSGVGQEFEKSFERPEVSIRIKDDVYPWMGAWVAVFDHPFFTVTDRAGRFELPGLPPGKYTLEVWQERCIPATQKVEVGPNAQVSVDLDLELKKE
jgi:hypothetical protein